MLSRLQAVLSTHTKGESGRQAGTIPATYKSKEYTNMNLLQTKNRLIGHRKQTYGYQWGKGPGRDEIGRLVLADIYCYL